MTTNLPYQDKPSSWSSHSIIAARLDLLPAGSKILDVGAASGTLARLCRNKSIRLFGVEPNAEWGQLASPLYENLWICSIESLDLEFLKGYDLVVLGDILEHLADPEAVLRMLVNHQPSSTIFLVSVPNVANLWVRLNLLIGRFEYTDRGILDRTHLRFFTRKTVREMIKNCGLEILTVQATPIPLELVSRFFLTPPGRLIHGALARLTVFMPTLLGYQFVVEARKP